MLFITECALTVLNHFIFHTLSLTILYAHELVHFSAHAVPVTLCTCVHLCTINVNLFLQTVCLPHILAALLQISKMGLLISSSTVARTCNTANLQHLLQA
jgi:hypothetical protein